MGIFIPDPSRPHLRYPEDFIREARRIEQARTDYRIAHALGKWSMTLARPGALANVHNHLVEQTRAAKQDVMGRLESGNRDWDGLRKSLASYIEFQTAADVVSGQTPLER